MSYDPLFDVARQVVDKFLGRGEYARLNRNNPGVPEELRQQLAEEVELTPEERSIEMKRRKKRGGK